MTSSGIEPPILDRRNRLPNLPRYFVVGLMLALCLACRREVALPPNIVLVVVDTLRADRLGAYGHDRNTSPAIDRLLGDRGVTFDRAYAQAPWTIPSMASLMTGIEPSLLLDDSGDPWGIPESASTLAQRLAAGGYNTAAFVANPTLHEGNGFAKGFRHFYTAPLELTSFNRHGDEFADRVLQFLAGRPAEPYFLYIHFLDPHDPYDNEDIRDGRTPFDPTYSGKLRGTDVHGLYLGALELDESRGDIEHLRALYDMEVRFVDRQVGRILHALPEADLGHTLVALTADHGEELFDHGSFKHGETLYDELVRVPLFLRWDGHVEPGTRIDTTVRLLDLFPTLLRVAGIEPEIELDGIDLLADMGLPERPAISRHLSMGPLRTSVVYRHQKLVLFDREADFAPADEREATLWRRDVQRMARWEVFDLASDANELRPLDEVDRDWLAKAEEALIRHLDRGLGEGLRIVVTELPEGSRLEVRIAGAIEADLSTLFLGALDTIEESGAAIRVSLFAEPGPKILLLAGTEGRVEEIELVLNGEEILPTWPEGPPSWPLRFDSLSSTPPPTRPRIPAVRLWYRGASEMHQGKGRDEETIERLRALGYLD